MRYFDKLTNFFASAYTNSSKHNSSFLSYLRIFFERNNKFKSTFARLGNTFRNSKWTDLKVQNIKTPLIANWFSWAFIMFIVSVLIFGFFGKIYLSKTLIQIPFLTDIFDGIFFLWANFINIVSLTWIQIWLTFVAFKFTLLNFFGLNQNYLYKAFNDTGSTSKTLTLPTTNTKKLNLSPSIIYDNEALNLVYHLSKVTKSLSYIKPQNLLQQSTTQKRFLCHMYDILPESLDKWETSEVKLNIVIFNQYINNYELDNTTSLDWNNCVKPSVYNLSTLSGPKFMTLSLNSLQNLNNTKFSPILNNLNIYTNLNQSKQDRWLMKNSLLNNSTALDLNAFTQAKKLVGVNLLDSSNTSSNIWNSSKMTQLSQAAELQKLSLLQNFIGLNGSVNLNSELKTVNELASGLNGFNWFESSSLWTTKKYFFTNQLKLNTVLLNVSSNKSTNIDPVSNTQNFTFITNLHNSNLNFQLNELTKNLTPTSTISQGLENLDSSTLHLNLNDKDLLKSFNLNIVNNLTSPIIETSATISDYNAISPFFKKKSLFFKK